MVSPLCSFLPDVLWKRISSEIDRFKKPIEKTMDSSLLNSDQKMAFSRVLVILVILSGVELILASLGVLNRDLFAESNAVVVPISEVSPVYDPFSGSIEVKKFSFETQDDRDFDGQPDDWVRRKDLGFPNYVKAQIDRKESEKGRQSLRFDINGGKAVYYSPVIKIDSDHSFVFEGSVKTKELFHDAAIISVSFLNHKRQRIQRFLTQPVSGTHLNWQKIQLGPLTPRDDVQFAVIGCHVVNDGKMDIEGKVWFDELWLGSLPRFSLETSFQTHFRQAHEPVSIRARVTGLDASKEYRLHLEMTDLHHKAKLSKTFLMKANRKQVVEEGKPNREPITWLLPAQKPGFYRVRSRLQRNDGIIVDKYTSFVVLDFEKNAGENGGFGWSMPTGRNGIPAKDLVEIAAQSGINYLKYPLWKEAYDKNTFSENGTGILLGDLVTNGIVPVGLLNHPTNELRNKFSKNWLGISEIFTMQPDFWRSSIDGVMARYSSSVRMWQLGEEDDRSFIGLSKMSETIVTLKKEFDRIGRDTRLGIHWDLSMPIPKKKHHFDSFLSLSSEMPLDEDGIRDALLASKDSGFERWILIKPLAKSNSGTIEERAADFIKKIIAAKTGGADGIFAHDVFDREHGLLESNGAPTELFLPWRTCAVFLKNKKYLGSHQMPEGSTNHVFSRNGEAIIAIWNSTKTKEEMYFGPEVKIRDMWGGVIRVQDNDKGQQIIPVGPLPIFITGCSEKIAKWRMAVRFEKGKLPSSTDFHPESILGSNTFDSGVGGSLSIHTPRDWEVEPRAFELGFFKGEQFRLPTYIKLPSGASIGKQFVRLDFTIDDDQRYKFSVYRDYQIGVGDVMIRVNVTPGTDGKTLRVEQVIVNNTQPPELLDFRCSLEIPGRQRQEKSITKLGSGQEAKRTYIIERPSQLREKKFKLKAEQADGRRVLNYIWKAEE